MFIIFFIISFIASVIGVISGLGGGIIIKPVLDMSGLAVVSVASFMSGCTVLSMTTMNLARSLSRPKDMLIDRTRSPFLAIGALGGGYLGNLIFDSLMTAVGVANQNIVGAIQAGILLLITVSVMIYMAHKANIKTRDVKNIFAALLIGLVLGILSAFLGIGGGPMNLVVLYYFFSMNSKEAAQNSLFIIFFSQLMSLSQTLLTGSVPLGLDLTNLTVMIVGGISGALLGGYFNKKLDEKKVDQLLMAVFTLIAIINVYNFVKFILF
ncbi:MAG: sulfite exporter TauE/SafE family protein [Clostridiaceae bacterium]|nr:sulfite exporter TauE/SafE family protein [Clostridiaceae bacterium]